MNTNLPHAHLFFILLPLYVCSTIQHSFYPLHPVWNPILVFENNHSLNKPKLPSMQVAPQHSVHWQTNTSQPYKDVLLNIAVISLRSPKNCYYHNYFIDGRNGHRLTLCTPACDWVMAPGADRINQNTKIYLKNNKKTQQLSKSLFTEAWATGTENKHQTVKNTASNTLLGRVSQLADRNKRNRGCTERVEPTWCCHSNHIPLWWWGDQPRE